MTGRPRAGGAAVVDAGKGLIVAAGHRAGGVAVQVGHDNPAGVGLTGHILVTTRHTGILPVIPVDLIGSQSFSAIALDWPSASAGFNRVQGSKETIVGGGTGQGAQQRGQGNEAQPVHATLEGQHQTRRRT